MDVVLALVVIVLVALAWRTWAQGRSRSSLPFWQLVAQHPDDAYEWFRGESCWLVTAAGGTGETLLGAAEEVTGDSGHIGPFKLQVPKLEGKTVHIYGRRDNDGGQSLMEVSQRRFMARYE